jgi:hypothetical protein
MRIAWVLFTFAGTIISTACLVLAFFANNPVGCFWYGMSLMAFGVGLKVSTE